MCHQQSVRKDKKYSQYAELIKHDKPQIFSMDHKSHFIQTYPQWNPIHALNHHVAVKNIVKHNSKKQPKKPNTHVQTDNTSIQ